MNLSIIIVNWNTRDLLRECLQSIFKNPPQVEFEVFVVDNASTDGSVEMVRENFPQVNLIENQENIGFARANNQGIRASSGKYVFLLNSDTLIFPDTLANLLSFADARPTAGIVGCKVLDRDGRIDYGCARHFPTIGGEFFNITYLNKVFPKNRLIGRYQMRYWEHNDSREVDCVLGACMLLRRDMLNQVGLLDERYFMYGEDIELCWRAKKRGYEVYFCSDAVIQHFGASSTRQVRPWMRREGIRSMYLFFANHYDRFYASLYLMMLPLAISINIMTKIFKRIFLLRESD